MIYSIISRKSNKGRSVNTYMKEKLHELLRNRVLIYTLLLAIVLTSGIVQTVATYDSSLGMGDNSTFYAFARNIVHGEVMYKNFIHFRTPGSVTFYSLVMRVLGQQQSTIEIASRIETLILYPLLLIISSMIIFRKRSPWYPVLAFLGLALLPGVAQLRAGFGILTIAVYLFTLDVRSRRQLWLLATGFLAFVTFYFGQEIFLMVVLCIAAAELVYWRQHGLDLPRLGCIVGGSIIGFIPLLLYMAIFSSLGNFLYYTLYYAFIQQPKFMNLPFPPFGLTNLVFYMPFIMYWFCFIVLYTNKRLGLKDGLLLSFGILRLITATGRSDFGHLIFSVPEVFVIVPYFAFQARWSELNKRTSKAVLPYAVVLLVLLALATKTSMALAPVPFVILLALHLRERKPTRVTPKSLLNSSVHLYAILGSLFVLFLFILAPTYLADAHAVKQGLFNDSGPAYRIGGVKTDEITYDEIQSVRASVAPLKPQTVFAFPIEPFYYSLAEHHASRFITFEPETTVKEQNEAIQDLEHSRPQVVIFDVLQSQGLSGSVWEISDYLTSHFTIRKQVAMRDILWVMVPEAHPTRQQDLVYQLYHDNTEKTNKTDTWGIQSSAQGLNNAVLENSPDIHFSVSSTNGAHLLLSILNAHGIVTPGLCGQVQVRYAGNKKTQTTKVCTTDGTVRIALAKSPKPVTLKFVNSSGQPVIWNDPVVTN